MSFIFLLESNFQSGLQFKIILAIPSNVSLKLDTLADKWSTLATIVPLLFSFVSANDPRLR